MNMTLIEMIDEIMIRAGQPLTVYSLAGSIREMFNEHVGVGSLIDALENESSFVRTGFRAWGLNHTERAERLARSFGL